MKYGYRISGDDESLESEIKPNGDKKPMLNDVLKMMIRNLPDQIIIDENKRRFVPASAFGFTKDQRPEIYWTGVGVLPEQITLKESDFNSKMDDESDPVLIFDDMDNISIGFYSYEQKRWFDSEGEYFDYEVKSWSPMPKGPTKEK